ncbi:MAG: hypothetical protein IPK70_00005 [Flavobacteriales bacterium]|nr:hypothetical protein [Flavobacteriales bacterium]MBK8225539.1 hypothetical protein [Flavobacteriales bacterium]
MSDNQRDRILRAFDELLLESLRLNDEAARAYLSNEGIDPNAEADYGKKVAKRIAFLMKAKQQQERDTGLLTRALDMLREKVAENAERTGEVLQRLLQARKPQVQFRNLSEWTDEQVRAVLDDVDIVELMEALEREDGSQ